MEKKNIFVFQLSSLQSRSLEPFLLSLEIWNHCIQLPSIIILFFKECCLLAYKVLCLQAKEILSLRIMLILTLKKRLVLW